MRWLLIVVGLLAAIAVAGVAPSLVANAGERRAEELPTATATRRTLEETAVAIGTVEPRVGAEVRVGSQVSGVVERLAVEVGDRVERGDLLVTLRAEAQRAAVAGLDAELAAAQAQRELAAAQLLRAEGLRELLSRADLDAARRTLEVRAAEVARTRARRDETRIALGYTEIRAPISGTVASVSTQVGETVAASFAAPTFVTIVDLARLEIRASVDETDIGRVRIGQEVAVRVDAFAGSRLPGAVRAVYPKAELVDNVVTYVVVVDLGAAASVELRPAMTVHVDFLLARRERVVAVPRAALFEEGERSYVVVRGADGYAERDVVAGLATTREVEIAAGLAEGDVVVADREAWRRREEER
jgi:macrolide-specific efflux system membrane fusion protein